MHAAVTATHLLFVDFDGATVTLGASDDATAGISELAAAPAYPPFDGSIGAPAITQAQAETVLVDRVRAYYAPFDLDVVAARPASGDYASVLIGGTGLSLSPAQAGGIAGIAPLDCGDANGRSLGFAFSDALAPRYGGLVALGAAIAHEAGHGYGLQHLTEPLDPMYSVAVPTQKLDDLFALSFRTGTYSPFVAGGGAPQPERCGQPSTLDNHALLLAALGARQTPASAVPSVKIDFPAAAATMPTSFPIEISAGDDVGVQRIEVYANLELVAILDAPPYRTTLALAPADSVTLTVEAIDADAQRARATLSFAVGTDAAAYCDELTPCPGAQRCVDRFCLPGGALDASQPAVDAGACDGAACGEGGGCALARASSPPPWGIVAVAVAVAVQRSRRRARSRRSAGAAG